MPKFVYVFFRVIPYGGEKTHKQNSPKIPGQSREIFVYVFVSLCVFSAPYNSLLAIALVILVHYESSGNKKGCFMKGRFGECALVPLFGTGELGHPQTCVYPDVCLGLRSQGPPTEVKTGKSGK